MPRAKRCGRAFNLWFYDRNYLHSLHINLAFLCFECIDLKMNRYLYSHQDNIVKKKFDPNSTFSMQCALWAGTVNQTAINESGTHKADVPSTQPTSRNRPNLILPVAVLWHCIQKPIKSLDDFVWPRLGKVSARPICLFNDGLLQ